MTRTTTDFTVTLDGPRLARARHAAGHIARMFFTDRDHAAFVADLAPASPLALAAWLSGRVLVRFDPESPDANDHANEIATARRIEEGSEPLAPFDPVRVVPAALSLQAIADAMAVVTRRASAHATSAQLFEGAGIPDAAEEQSARARGLRALHRELYSLFQVEASIARAFALSAGRLREALRLGQLYCSVTGEKNVPMLPRA